MGKYKYKWVSNMTKTKDGCFFSYSGASTKNDLAKELEKVLRVAADQRLPKKDRVAIATGIQEYAE